MTETSPDTNQPTARRRWPGVLLSLMVPGFGLVRAGRPLRGLAWFVGLQFVGVAVALLLIARAVPSSIVVGGFIVSLLCALAMLVDSFRPGRLTWPLALAFVAGVVAVILLPSASHLVARAFKVPTGAMEPTLMGASRGTPDHIIADRITYLFSPPNRGDLVVFSTDGIPGLEGGAMFIKRVAGLPGERIEIRNGRLFADGRQLDEGAGIPSITYVEPSVGARLGLRKDGSYLVPNASFFVLGDNSAHSYDSRYWGSVPRKNIDGKVGRIYYPFSRIGVPR